ncbi:MAG: flavin reductase family protein [Proteobacteria bacterium]|nr:flavin reductase family protein [Pseudomonadota bacterium]
MTVTEDQFRKTLGLFPTGVTIITAPQKGGQDIGITISSLTSVSLSPPQILFCLSKHSKTMPVFKASPYFAINILSESQSHLSDGFARHVPMEWEKVDTYRHSATGCLLIKDTLGYIICEKGAIYDGEDHEIIIGKVLDLEVISSASPLVRQKGQYLTTQSIHIEPAYELTYRKSSSF